MPLLIIVIILIMVKNLFFIFQFRMARRSIPVSNLFLISIILAFLVKLPIFLGHL